MAQTGCTEEKAKEALAAENGDLINASECSGTVVPVQKKSQPSAICAHDPSTS